MTPDETKTSTKLKREMMHLAAAARDRKNDTVVREFTQMLAQKGWHYCDATTRWARVAMNRAGIDAWLPNGSAATKDRTTLSLPQGAVLIAPDYELEFSAGTPITLTVHFPL